MSISPLVLIATALSVLTTIPIFLTAVAYLIIEGNWESCQCDEPIQINDRGSCSHRRTG